MIKAIPTKYAGCLFRSRLEARWATFFDHLGIKWEYETEGFVFNDRCYLPDFWLPELRLWVECKGTLNWNNGKYDEIEFIKLFKEEKGDAVCLIKGNPGDHKIWLFAYESSDSTCGPIEDQDAYWIVSGAERATLKSSSKHEIYDNEELEHRLDWFESYPIKGSDSLVLDAINKARSARF